MGPESGGGSVVRAKILSVRYVMVSSSVEARRCALAFEVNYGDPRSDLGPSDGCEALGGVEPDGWMVFGACGDECASVVWNVSQELSAMASSRPLRMHGKSIDIYTPVVLAPGDDCDQFRVLEGAEPCQ